MLGYSMRRLRLRSSTQPTHKFIKALTIKDCEFLFNESNRRALTNIRPQFYY
ncbi:asl2552 [Nostoc sp. PCC 7120 = FACHB-418]|nr:asl2552 [Nostoc sp. PCC 7120 = FACHB-418]